MLTGKKNIEINRARLDELKSLKDFPELQPLVDYFINSLSFSIWNEERLIEYYKTSNVASLEYDYDGLPVIEKTKDVLADLRAAQDPSVRWKLSYYKWANIAIGLYRNKEGAVPLSVWESFKKTHGIRESITYEEGQE